MTCPYCNRQQMYQWAGKWRCPYCHDTVKPTPELVRNSTPADDRLVICVHATGLVYCDRTREEDGDYVVLARLPFRTLELEWKGNLPTWAYYPILEDAKRLHFRRGEPFEVSTCGQTVILGE